MFSGFVMIVPVPLPTNLALKEDCISKKKFLYIISCDGLGLSINLHFVIKSIFPTECNLNQLADCKKQAIGFKFKR